MTQEQIQMQADKYADKYAKEYGLNDATTFGMSLGFKAGANWRIKSVWRTEAPMHSELCLIEFLRSKNIVLAYSGYFEDGQPYFKTCFTYATFDMNQIARYAYVKDLMPEE